MASEPATKQRVPPPTGFWSEDRSLSVFLISIIVVYFILTPLAELGPVMAFTVETSFALCLISGITAVFGKRPVARLAKLVCMVAWLTHQFRMLTPGTLLTEVDLFLTFFCLSSFVVVLITRVLSDGEGNYFRLQGAAAAYIMTAVAWGHLYTLLETVQPGCFSGRTEHLDAKHLLDTLTFFSSITLTTVGYGDIVPVHPFARSMVSLEAFWGVLYPAILVSRLVTLSLPPDQSK